MFVSMTGYGRGESSVDGCRFQVEIRGVNHRFCDVQLRIPKEYLGLESRIVTEVKRWHRRGRVEVHLRRSDDSGAGNRVHLDVRRAEQYYEQLEALRSKLGVDEAVGLGHVLGLEGVACTVDDSPNLEVDWPPISSALRGALLAAKVMRKTEGAVLQEDVSHRLETLRSLHQEIVGSSQGLQEDIAAKLERRVSEVLEKVGAGELDRTRLLQEVVYLVDRADVSEEVARLGSHLDQFTAAFDDEGPVGKKLEFLLQELLRETNTIASKSHVTEVVRRCMDMKVELEKIREQTQNVE